MPAITFPLEIKETILELLAEDDKGHLALKTCSLVCQAFLPICRKHIFESIVLDDSDLLPTSRTTYAFECLLRETPEIADYIRKLDYNIRATDLTNSSIQESMKRISRLEFLSVQYRYRRRLDWCNNPIRPTLLHLLHLPTLTHFEMTGMNEFLVSDLMPCVNLEYLDICDNYMSAGVAEDTTLHAALPEHSIQLHEFVARTWVRTPTIIMKLCSARRPDGKPIIDFGFLSKVTVTLDGLNECEAILELFRRCHSLTNAHISFCDPQNVKPSLSGMLRPSMQTLRHIVVDIYVVRGGDDSLLGFPSEFEDMRTKNIIETITIKIFVPKYVIYRLGDDWDRLDEILTSPGWFSLKQVSLAIEIPCTNRGYSELEEALRKLPETQFLRLSSSNSVSLDIRGMNN